MRRIAAAIAAIALIAGTAHAQGQGGGRGNDRGGGKPAENGKQGGGERGGGQGNADRGNRGDGNGASMAQSMRGAEPRSNGQGNAMRDDRGNAERGNSGDRDRGNSGNADRGQGSARQAERSVERADNGGRNDDRAVVIERRDGRDVTVVRTLAGLPPRGLIDGCPPGLAKKNPPCVPPGQVGRDRDWDWGDRFDRPDFWGLRGLGDGRYLYDDGYLLRYGPDGRVGGYIPLLGGALSIGNPWPTYYEPVAFPNYYERYYGLGPYSSYRYADNVIYRVDPETAAITSIAALLTGDNFAVGQPMPLGYDVYNVPYGYRDRYADGPDAYYRYSDGYVYQVDPATRLIAAVIELVT